MMPDKERISLMGLDVDVLTIAETTSFISSCIKSRVQIQHSFVNANSYYVLGKDRRIAGMINNSDLISADGQAVIWASKILSKPLPERVSGLDLMDSLLDWVKTTNEKVFLLGAEEEIVAEVDKVFKNRYGDIVAGYHHGFFTETEEDQIAKLVNDS